MNAPNEADQEEIQSAFEEARHALESLARTLTKKGYGILSHGVKNKASSLRDAEALLITQWNKKP